MPPLALAEPQRHGASVALALVHPDANPNADGVPQRDANGDSHAHADDERHAASSHPGAQVAFHGAASGGHVIERVLAAVTRNTAALDLNTAALKRLLDEESRMDTDIQAAVAVAQAVADAEHALHTDLDTLVQALGGAQSLSAEDRAALTGAVSRLQGTVASLQQDAVEAVGATPAPTPAPAPAPGAAPSATPDPAAPPAAGLTSASTPSWGPDRPQG